MMVKCVSKYQKPEQEIETSVIVPHTILKQGKNNSNSNKSIIHKNI